ncbi:unnamed protein product, partial [Amoebophrya sp. A25]
SLVSVEELTAGSEDYSHLLDAAARATATERKGSKKQAATRRASERWKDPGYSGLPSVNGEIRAKSENILGRAESDSFPGQFSFDFLNSYARFEPGGLYSIDCALGVILKKRSFVGTREYSDEDYWDGLLPEDDENVELTSRFGDRSSSVNLDSRGEHAVNAAGPPMRSLFKVRGDQYVFLPLERASRVFEMPLPEFVAEPKFSESYPVGSQIGVILSARSRTKMKTDYEDVEYIEGSETAGVCEVRKVLQQSWLRRVFLLEYSIASRVMTVKGGESAYGDIGVQYSAVCWPLTPNGQRGQARTVFVEISFNFGLATSKSRVWVGFLGIIFCTLFCFVAHRWYFHVHRVSLRDASKSKLFGRRQRQQRTRLQVAYFFGISITFCISCLFIYLALTALEANSDDGFLLLIIFLVGGPILGGFLVPNLMRTYSIGVVGRELELLRQAIDNDEMKQKIRQMHARLVHRYYQLVCPGMSLRGGLILPSVNIDQRSGVPLNSSSSPQQSSSQGGTSGGSGGDGAANSTVGSAANAMQRRRESVVTARRYNRGRAVGPTVSQVNAALRELNRGFEKLKEIARSESDRLKRLLEVSYDNYARSAEWDFVVGIPNYTDPQNPAAAQPRGPLWWRPGRHARYSEWVDRFDAMTHGADSGYSARLTWYKQQAAWAMAYFKTKLVLAVEKFADAGSGKRLRMSASFCQSAWNSRFAISGDFLPSLPFDDGLNGFGAETVSSAVREMSTHYTSVAALGIGPPKDAARAGAKIDEIQAEDYAKCADKDWCPERYMSDYLRG